VTAPGYLAVLVLDEHVRAHLSMAIVNHLQWCRSVGHRQPGPLVDLLAVLTPAAPASTGPQRPKLADADPVPEAELMTYKGACAMLRCSERTLRRMAADGRIASVQVGARGRRFPRQAIEDLVAGR
jgi:excisionase family DNA binding protein